jgi:F-type H+-transporting ATPase subunit delta
VGKGISKVASKYARALLRSVEEKLGAEVNQSTGKTKAQELAVKLESLALAFQTNRDLHNALLSPMFSEAERLSALTALAKAMELPELVQKFLRIVGERGRLVLIGEISLAFTEFADRSAQVVVVEVVTARAITPSEQAEVSQSLAKMIEGRLEYRFTVDPEILGGMLVRYAGNVLDGTLRSRLQQVERTLLQ